NRQSAIGNRQSAIGNRQSAIGNRQSAILGGIMLEVKDEFPAFRHRAEGHDFRSSIHPIR
ncbi:MAG TPA: 6-phosphofructokinase, partial [Blastocatellia bacterium]|nr:6-phosphofructokinase [Blastocatellia bacterium]